MALLTYNFSPSLKFSLEKIDSLQKEVFLVPVTLKAETGLRFEAMLDRTYWFWALEGNPLSKPALRSLFSSQTKKGVGWEIQEVTDYRKAFDWISWNWLASSKPISLETVSQLYNLACLKTCGKADSFPSASGAVKHLLEYLQKGKEHPVIQAAIAYIQLMSLGVFGENTKKIAHLLSYLILYKYYYHFRGLLVIEECWKHDFLAYQKAYQTALENKNLGLWLDYFTQTMVIASEKVIHKLSSPQISPQTDAFSSLNERQKEILAVLENPKETITNRKIKQVFKISQITASRDLTKLANLGLVLIHGKGRSVYYTRA